MDNNETAAFKLPKRFHAKFIGPILVSLALAGAIGFGIGDVEGAIDSGWIAAILLGFVAVFYRVQQARDLQDAHGKVQTIMIDRDAAHATLKIRAERIAELEQEQADADELEQKLRTALGLILRYAQNATNAERVDMRGRGEIPYAIQRGDIRVNADGEIADATRDGLTTDVLDLAEGAVDCMRAVEWQLGKVTKDSNRHQRRAGKLDARMEVLATRLHRLLDTLSRIAQEAHADRTPNRTLGEVRSVCTQSSLALFDLLIQDGEGAFDRRDGSNGVLHWLEDVFIGNAFHRTVIGERNWMLDDRRPWGKKVYNAVRDQNDHDAGNAVLA